VSEAPIARCGPETVPGRAGPAVRRHVIRSHKNCRSVIVKSGIDRTDGRDSGDRGPRARASRRAVPRRERSRLARAVISLKTGSGKFNLLTFD
jgi:hypothetical protein